MLLAFLGFNSHFFWTVGVVRYCRHGQPHFQCSAADSQYIALVTVLTRLFSLSFFFLIIIYLMSGAAG